MAAIPMPPRPGTARQPRRGLLFRALLMLERLAASAELPAQPGWFRFPLL